MTAAPTAPIALGKRLFPLVLSLVVWSGAASPALSQTKVVTNFTTTGTPSVAVYNDKVILAFTGMDSKVYVAESSDGVDFSGATAVANAISSGVGPGLAAFNGRLWLSWTGGYNDINIINSTDGINYANKVVYSTLQAYNGPKLGTYCCVNGTTELVLAYAGLDSWHTLTMAYSTDGVNFSAPEHPAGTAGSAVSSLIDNPVPSVPNGNVDAPTFTNSPFNSNPSQLWFAATVSGEPPAGGCAYDSSNRIIFSEDPYAPASMGISAPNSGPPAPGYCWPTGIVSTSGVGITSIGTTVYVAYYQPDSTVMDLNVYQLENGNLTLVSSSATARNGIANPTLLTYNTHVYLYWVGTDSAHHINAIEIQ